jgi:hypothetical protein
VVQERALIEHPSAIWCIEPSVRPMCLPEPGRTPAEASPRYADNILSSRCQRCSEACRRCRSYCNLVVDALNDIGLPA